MVHCLTNRLRPGSSKSVSTNPTNHTHIILWHRTISIWSPMRRTIQQGRILIMRWHKSHFLSITAKLFKQHWELEVLGVLHLKQELMLMIQYFTTFTLPVYRDWSYLSQQDWLDCPLHLWPPNPNPIVWKQKSHKTRRIKNNTHIIHQMAPLIWRQTTQQPKPSFKDSIDKHLS